MSGESIRDARGDKLVMRSFVKILITYYIVRMHTNSQTKDAILVLGHSPDNCYRCISINHRLQLVHIIIIICRT